MEACDKTCRWDFVDRNHTVIKCLECHAREVLRPQSRDQTLAALAAAERWAGAPLDLPGVAQPSLAVAPADPPAQPPVTSSGASLPGVAQPSLAVALVDASYESFDGQQVELTVKAFQRMLCRDASEDHARYALGWCAHNKIDPFSNEAYFSVIAGQLVIQVSKDAWFKRVENNARFLGHDGGIIVEVSLQRIKESILGGLDDYLIAPELRAKLLDDFTAGRALEPKGISARLRVKKRGIFLQSDETLLGGWATVTVKDRPSPYRFEIDKEGWQTTTQGGQGNTFWQRKAPFMLWKGALKNACRLAFPDLSGLIGRPEAPEEFDPASSAGVPAGDYEIDTRRLQRKLFALGKEVPPPLGPLGYPELHNLATALYDGKGISALPAHELLALVSLLEGASHGEATSQDTLTSALATADHASIT